MFSVGVLIRIRRSISRGMKPRIRISTKMSWIRNTDQYDIYLEIFGSMSKQTTVQPKMTEHLNIICSKFLFIFKNKANN
jgi:hypothetical protein